MNEEVLELTLKYPGLVDNLNQAYRVELLVLYYKLNPLDTFSKRYVQAADVYNMAHRLKVSSVIKAIEIILDVRNDNANMLVQYAKHRGLITKGFKTNHNKGYLQKNYVSKSDGMKPEHHNPL